MKLTPWLRSLKNGIARAFHKEKVKRRQFVSGAQLLSESGGAELLEDRTVLNTVWYTTAAADGIYDNGHLLQPQPNAPIDLPTDPRGVKAIPIDVYFVGLVDINIAGGRPTLQFNTSSTDPNAPNYPGLTGVATYLGDSAINQPFLRFWYEIRDGENTPGPLQPNPVLKVTAAFTNGAVITDGAGPVSMSVIPTSGPSANGTIIDEPSILAGTVLNKNIFIDTKPIILNVDSTTPDSFPYNNDPSQGVIRRPYRVGDEPIHITVTFSEPVSVTGIPELILNTDGLAGVTAGDGKAIYKSGSGTNVLKLDYIINPGDNTSDLDVASSSAFQTNNGSQIRDQDFTQDNGILTVAGPTGGGVFPGVLGQNRAIQVDTRAPVIGPRPDEAPNTPFVGVTSTISDGTYGAGTQIEIRVSYNEAVVLTGSPTLVLATGPVNREATFAGFDGTNTLKFLYVVQPGDLSSDLDYVGTNSLKLNGGSLTDVAGNAAVLTLPTPGTVGSLSYNKNIVIDTVVAVTNVTTTVPSGSYGIGQVIPIQIVFNKNVTVFGTPQLILDLDSPADSVVVNYTSGSGTKILTFNYVIQAGHNTPDLDYISNAALLLNGGAIIDTTGNGNAILTLPIPGSAGSLGFNKNILIDTNIPQVATVSASASVPDGTYVAGQTIPITVTFSEPVSVTGTPQIVLDTNGLLGVQPFLQPGQLPDKVVNYVSGSGTNTLTFNYTIEQGQNSRDLDALYLQLANGSFIKDLAGNDIAPTGSILTLPQLPNEALVTVNQVPNVVPVAQVDDVTVTQVVANQTYTITVGGTNYSILATGADTSATIATKLRQRVNQVGGLVTASGFGNVVRLTATTPGSAFTTTVGSSLSAANVVANVSATAQVDKITITSVSQGTVYDFAINGTPLSYTASGSDTTGTVAIAIRNIINSHVTLSTQVNATSAGAEVTITSNTAGTPFKVATGHSLAGNRNLVIDTAAIVTNITSSSLDGIYQSPQTIMIEVTFSEEVEVTAGNSSDVQLVLETNGQPGIQNSDARAVYSTGSSTKTLTFLYTIGAGESSVDLNYAVDLINPANSALQFLNGATIRDLDSPASNVDTKLPAPGAAGSLSANKNIQIDDFLINDAPVNSVPGTQTIQEDVVGGLVFSSGNNNRILIQDVDAAGGTIQVVLTAGHGTLTLPDLTGLVSVVGNNTAVVTIQGDLATINARLNGLVFTPDLNVNSATTSGIQLTVATDDLGNTGAGGNKTDTDIIPIFVNAVNDAPVAASQTVQTAVGTPITITLSATDVDLQSLAYAIDQNALPTHGSLSLISGGNTIVYTPNPGYVGSDSFRFTATDGSLLSNLGVITINVVPVVSITGFPDVTVNEGPLGVSNAVFTITLSQPPALPVTIFYDVTPGTATPGTDYQIPLTTSVTFAPGQQTAFIQVPIIGDAIDEPNETFFVNLLSATNAVLLDTQATGTIQNDDGLSINDVTITEGNSGTTLFTFNVTLSSPSANTVTVNYRTVDGTASQNGDYNNQQGTLTFAPGEQTKTVSIVVNGDLFSEQDETFYVDLFGPSGSSLGKFRGVGTILNDDTAPTYSISDVTITEGNAGTKTANFVVTLSAISGQVVTINYATADSTAIAGSDYFATSGTITFAPGTTTQLIPVQLIGDQIVEIDEAFQVNLSGAVNASPIKSQGIGTILNDDGVSISDGVLQSEGNAGVTFMVFTVTAPQTGGQTVTVDYTTAPGTATPGEDYTPVSGTLVFSGGATSKTILVPVIGDYKQESDETFFINLSNVVNAPLLDAQGLGVIIDDDLTPTITVTDAFVQEGDSGTKNAVFTLTLSAATGIPVSINYATQEGTAKEGSDYVGVSGTVTFAPFQTIQTIVVPILGDTIDEFDESFTVHLTNPVNAAFNGPDPVGTISDNDATPTLSFNPVTKSEGQAGQTQVTMTVTLSAPSGKVITMNYHTTDGTALSVADPNGNGGNDYIAQSGTLTFQPGVVSQDIVITVNGDALYELDETFGVTLDGFVNVTANPTQRAVTIVNDDPKPTLRISDAPLLNAVTEGDSGTTPLQFTISLDQPSALPVTVTYSTASGTAQSGSDYQNTVGSVTFLPGETSKTIVVNIFGDLVVEGDETFLVNLSSPVNAVIGDPFGVGTIVNDDILPSFEVSDASVVETDTGFTQMVFTVYRNGSTALPSSVNFSTSNGTATAGLDFTALTGTLNFAPGETFKLVTINIKGDDIAEPNESFFLNLSNPSNGVITDGQGLGTIINDDNAPPAVTLPPGPLSANEETNLTITGITVTDPDAGSAPVTVVLSALHGTIVIRNDVVNGVTSGQILNNGTASVTLTGSLAAINTTLASLNGVVYRGFTDFFGVDTFTVIANDLGNTGSNGVEKTDTKAFIINVANVNDGPTITFTGDNSPTPDPVVSTKGNAVAAYGLPNSLTLADPDNFNFSGGEITVSILNQNQNQFFGKTDKLSIRNQGKGAGLIGVSGTKITFSGVVIGTFKGGKPKNGVPQPLIITLNSNATIAATTALMKNIMFSTSKTKITALPRTVSMVMTDGKQGLSNPAVTTIDVTN